MSGQVKKKKWRSAQVKAKKLLEKYKRGIATTTSQDRQKKIWGNEKWLAVWNRSAKCFLAIWTEVILKHKAVKITQNGLNTKLQW